MRSIITTLLLFGLISLQAAPSTISEFIKIDQFGFRLNAQKTAIISNPISGFNAADSFTPGATYEIRKWDDDITVFSGSPTEWNSGAEHVQSGDQVWWFDFSNLTTAGEYYVYDVANDVGSYKFSIDDEVYNEVLRQAMRTFYYQRCGTSKTVTHGGDWNDGVCHHGAGQDLASRSILAPNDASTELDLSGGWHDAGDYNKYVSFTYSPMHALLFAYSHNPTVFGDDYNIPESGNGIPDIVDELIYELDWLKKMQLGDGSVLTKLAVTDYQSSSPPSSDANARYYGPAQASSTAITASIFAHAYLVLKDFPTLTTYADDLLTRAEEAWDWIEVNPAYSAYDNAGFSSATTLRSIDEQKEDRTGAAMLLFAATGTTAYKTFAEVNYTNIRPIQWTYWYPFQPTIQDIALFYADLAGASSSVATTIQNSFSTSTNSNNSEMLPAYLGATDAYRAQVGDNDYTWGTNQIKANMAIMFNNMNYYNLDAGNALNYQNAAEGYVHYLHGANPQGKVMMTAMNDYGADNSCNEIYHIWFGDGTDYDNAETSLFGPPPGYIPGGANPTYAPDDAYTGPTISPPVNQPIQKAYKDWNTSYPENSWSVTETAIYYQAAYVQLLSVFASTTAVLPLELDNFSAKLTEESQVRLNWNILTFDNVDNVEIERKNNQGVFEQLGELRDIQVGENDFLDKNPQVGLNYYRLKINDLDGKVSYSKIESVNLAAPIQVNVFPNPAKEELTVLLKGKEVFTDLSISLVNVNGTTVMEKKYKSRNNELRESINIRHLPRGIYWLRTEYTGDILIRKVILK